jgi:hypothetical protein
MSMFWKDFEMQQQDFDKKYLFIFLLQYLFIVISFYYNTFLL